MRITNEKEHLETRHTKIEKWQLLDMLKLFDA